MSSIDGNAPMARQCTADCNAKHLLSAHCSFARPLEPQAHISTSQLHSTICCYLKEFSSIVRCSRVFNNMILCTAADGTLLRNSSTLLCYTNNYPKFYVSIQFTGP